MLKIYVINLAKSVERREKISTRLHDLGCDYELFEAVDGRNEPHALFSRYDENLTKRSRRKILSGGELGCFASHFLLWKKCIELDAPIVVMEDDVGIEDRFLAALSIAEKNIQKWNYLRLAGTDLHKRPYTIIGQIGEFEFVEHRRGPAGTLCYVLHPLAAIELIRHADTWFLAVDDYIDRYWVHRVDCYSLMPFVVTVENSRSDIVREEKLKIKFLIKIQQEKFRATEAIRRWWYRASSKLRRRTNTIY